MTNQAGYEMLPTDALGMAEVKAIRHFVKLALNQTLPAYYQEIGLRIIAWCVAEIERVEGEP